MKKYMDPKIWCQLPNHLLEHVLSLLPLKTFVNLRSTCKHFNSLLFSPFFISKHSNNNVSCSSFILLSHPQILQKFSLFNTITNSWCNLSLPLPPILTSSSNLLSSSNGLLCFSIPKSSCFIVCNLLGNSSRKVKFPNCPFNFELLSLVPFSNGFKIFMLSSSIGLTHKTLIYDSVLDSWLQFEGFDPILNKNCHQKGVFFKGCLYFITSEPFQMVVFTLESGNWVESTIELLGNLTFGRFVSDEDDEKLYLIGGIGVNGISTSMKLWELINGDENNWVEIVRLPEMLCRKFVSVCYHNYEHVYCFWHEGLICVCCYNWPEILYYKVSRRSWHWLPKCPSLPEKWNCGFRWFSFKPQVYAIV